MLRRLHPEQPESFAFTPDNKKWAEGQITKYPEGRQASAIIALLWRAQEQEGWLTRPAIEYVADMLGMAYIRALEVATFYFMFQLQPVGSVANIQVCGTLSCMLCGSENLIGMLKEKVAPNPHEISADGKFSWEEVECLGACANAPMAQIGKDYYEDLTVERLSEILDEMAAGRVPVPGPQNGRYAAEPLSGLTSLTQYESGRTQYNASAQLAADLGETIKRIDGSEVPVETPWVDAKARGGKAVKAKAKPVAKPAAAKPAKAKPAAKTEAATAKAAPAASGAEKQPDTLNAPREGGADDLKLISGVGPKLEQTLNELGFWHFDQIEKWTAQEIEWVDARLTFKGRIARDNWMEQARILAAGGETEFSKRKKRK
ncbi:NADH-quinone oxidoreductase subunit E [Aquicoccus sp. G2-2]|uniref:NADH-quinone oxidoreductase subunit E n=1 Tax=Aquicoccus sp. G2-2 TaxID=3092120 RepID=UPI002AE031A5|nr:NADH-quinone oxidoreductase subunit E [Aquicoccus sp. G2-2]MEA1113298.1 NADH-quinone oxidoreductase subunit E [Aquicoccus sp. G2-2]